MAVCKCCKGTCCQGTTCSRKTMEECDAVGGIFRAAGTPCEPNPCSVCGGCCEVDGEYDHTLDESGCETAKPQYLCELELVDTDPCPDGWFAAGPNCYKHTCIEDCDACVTDPVNGGTVNCFLDDGRQYCDGSPGIWHALCPEIYCLDYIHSIPLLAGTGGTYFEETIAVPDGCDAVVLSGSVDDDIKINGSIIQAGEFVTAGFSPDNPAHEVHYEFTPAGPSFTIAVKDNYGSVAAANLKICFYSSAAALSALAIGPGTELKKLLARFGIHSTPTCKCNKMAQQMNEWGAEGCLTHIEEIVDVMGEEAHKRGLPFIRAAGRILVKKAIRNSRGNSQ